MTFNMKTLKKNNSLKKKINKATNIIRRKSLALKIGEKDATEFTKKRYKPIIDEIKGLQTFSKSEKPSNNIKLNQNLYNTDISSDDDDIPLSERIIEITSDNDMNTPQQSSNTDYSPKPSNTDYSPKPYNKKYYSSSIYDRDAESDTYMRDSNLNMKNQQEKNSPSIYDRKKNQNINLYSIPSDESTISEKSSYRKDRKPSLIYDEDTMNTNLYNIQADENSTSSSDFSFSETSESKLQTVPINPNISNPSRKKLVYNKKIQKLRNKLKEKKENIIKNRKIKRKLKLKTGEKENNIYKNNLSLIQENVDNENDFNDDSFADESDQEVENQKKPIKLEKKIERNQKRKIKTIYNELKDYVAKSHKKRIPFNVNKKKLVTLRKKKPMNTIEEGFMLGNITSKKRKLNLNQTENESKYGGDLMKLSKNKIDFVYYDDPNELVNRLLLLKSSHIAGNSGLHNEIKSIEEELRERNII